MSTLRHARPFLRIQNGNIHKTTNQAASDEIEEVTLSWQGDLDLFKKAKLIDQVRVASTSRRPWMSSVKG